jgi:outer membrane lipoprotein SlyB
MQRLVSLPLCVFLVGSLLLSGCTSQYGDQKTKVNYYPQCYQPVSQLRQDENSTGKSTAAGAVGGALLGALIGGLATGKASGAVVGAVAGGAAGAVAGNVYGKSKAQDRDAAYLRQYSQQLGNESASMNRSTAAAKVATKCYDEQFKLATAQFKAGQITRIEFQDRYNEIRSGLEETSYILKDTATTMAKKDSEYQQALAEPYTSAEPAASSTGTAKKKTAAKAKPTASRSADENAVATQASQWKSSREDLENTRQDVNSRMSSYEETVNNLLG